MFKRYLLILSLLMLSVLPTHNLRADGDVTVVINEDGDLRVTGQNNTEQCILVVELADGLLRFSTPSIAGASPTTFNGNAVLTVSGVFGDVRLDLKSGRKVLIMCEGSQTDFDIFGDFRVTSSGSEPVIVILDDIDVDGRTSISTKGGDDAILLLQCDFRAAATINSGSGNDVIGTEAAADFFDESEFKTGSGDDVALMVCTQFELEADFRMGSGNDAVGFQDCCFALDVAVNGNGGFDTFSEDNSEFLLGIQPKSIEDVLVGPNAIGQIVDLALENATFVAAFDIITDLGLGQ